MGSAWRKRGRPRLDRPSTDGGTPEAQARRAALAGGGDPALTEHPLGLMLARGLISPEQHEAGIYYAGLYVRAVGRTALSVAPLYRRLLAEEGRGREIDEESQRRIEALYRQGKNRLLAAGRRIAAAVEDLAVFGRPARFLSRAKGAGLRRGPDAAELAAVQEGLSVLVACYGRGARQRGRMEAYRAASLTRRSPAMLPVPARSPDGHAMLRRDFDDLGRREGTSGGASGAVEMPEHLGRLESGLADHQESHHR